MTEFWIQFAVMIGVVGYVALVVVPELWNDR
jgi:hypothetical protein